MSHAGFCRPSSCSAPPQFLSTDAKRINGYWRLEGLMSSTLIFSICRARLVACLAFEALAEKRRTKSCKSAICCLALALSLAACARAMLEASMKSS